MPFTLERSMALLDRARWFAEPRLPEEARFRAVKRLVLRLLRIVTRDQRELNTAVLNALAMAFSDLEAALAARREETRAVAEEVGRAEGRGERLVGEAESRAVARVEALAAEVAATREEVAKLRPDLVDALRREAAARDALGRDVAATQRRVDVLETDRDVRWEAEARQTEEDAAERLRLKERVATLEGDLRQLRLEWTSLRQEVRNSVAPAVPRVPVAASHGAPDAGDPLRAGLYADFERSFRGSEEEIRERQRRDVALFAGAPGPVVDLGCGRGEFLELLREADIDALGCDANAVMVARAREKGLSVEQADLFAFLAARPDASLGGITAYQVVEHLPPAALFDLAELALVKLARNGRLLFETVNPESVYAMRWFWMDLTHVRPVPAPSLAQLMKATGFRDVTVDFRSPVPPGEALPDNGGEALGPVARLLFGPQDYAVTGLK